MAAAAELPWQDQEELEAEIYRYPHSLATELADRELIELAKASPRIYNPDRCAISRELARRELIEFTEYTYPQYQTGWFSRHLAARLDQFLDDCVAGLSPRLMIFAPPRSGKSELVSRRFPAYALGKYPHLSFIATSYGGTLAGRMSRDVERIVADDTYSEIFPGVAFPRRGIPNPDDKVSSVEFRELVNHRGTYRAAGVREGITGQGADVFLIDDPVKDGKDARSQTVRDGHWEWYTTTAYTRLQPGAGMLLVMTRWNMEDLAGRLREAAEKDEGDQFEIIEFPAIAEHDDEFRKEGEALDPARYPLKRLLKIKRAVGAYTWDALYQQHPTIQGGSVFGDDWWQYYDVLPRIKYRRIYADTAQKTKDGKDLERTQVMKIEDKSSGTGLIQQLRARTHDAVSKHGPIPVRGIERNVDKVTRADDGAPYIESGYVVLPERAPWIADYKAEFSAFNKEMSHDHDDQVDPTLDAIQDMLGGTINLYQGAIT
jgi:predicted phage terminase large subunit-like protein